MTAATCLVGAAPGARGYLRMTGLNSRKRFPGETQTARLVCLQADVTTSEQTGERRGFDNNPSKASPRPARKRLAGRAGARSPGSEVTGTPAPCSVLFLVWLSRALHASSATSSRTIASGRVPPLLISPNCTQQTWCITSSPKPSEARRCAADPSRGPTS